MDAHVANDLDMIFLISHAALFGKFEDKKLIGLSGLQIDDSLNAGNMAFEDLSELVLK